MLQFCYIMSQENTQPKRPMDVPVLRKLGLIVIVSVCLYVTFLITATHPSLEGNQGSVIFASVMGGTVFTFFLMFAREVKQWKKLHN